MSENAKRNNTNKSNGDGFYFIKSFDIGDTFTKSEFVKQDFLNPLNVEIIWGF